MFNVPLITFWRKKHQGVSCDYEICCLEEKKIELKKIIASNGWTDVNADDIENVCEMQNVYPESAKSNRNSKEKEKNNMMWQMTWPTWNQPGCSEILLGSALECFYSQWNSKVENQGTEDISDIIFCFGRNKK